MITALLLALALPPQLGGSWELFHDVDWTTGYDALAVLGDADGDGVDDLIAGDAWGAAGIVAVLSGADGRELLRITRAEPSFGHAVAVVGDLDLDGRPDFAVGAPYHDANGLTDNGSVEVFSGVSGAMLYLRTGFVSQGNFGQVVTALGDTNANGFTDFLVSAPGIVPNATGGRGVAYLFDGRTASLRFTVDGPDASTVYGWNAAALPDYSALGAADFAIGVPDATLSGLPSWSGRVLVFRGDSGAQIRSLDGAGYRFGGAIAGYPDTDGDGRGELAVSEAAGSQQAYVHLFDSNGILTLTLAGATGTGFGSALAAADFDHDGRADLAIGLPFVGLPGLAGSGSVALHRLPGGEPLAVLHGQSASARIGTSLHLGLTDRHGGAGRDLIAGGYGYYSSHLAEYFALNDILFAERDYVSAFFGDRLTFDIDFPETEAGRSYLMLASLAGTGSTNFGGIQVPLARDTVFNHMLVHPPQHLHGARGQLNASGDATAVLQLPPRLAMPWMGQTLYLAAVSLDGYLGRISSIAVPVSILF